MKSAFLVFALAALFSSPLLAADPCRFSGQQFTGVPADQARCLLRKVLPGGIVDAHPLQLPAFLAANVGKPVALNKAKLTAYLHALQIADREIGGSLDSPVSRNGSGTKALYFMIHDTSDEVGRSFPSTINTSAWGPNHLANRDLRVSHIFINRLGQSATGHDYSEAVGATKREQRERGLHGLFLHHELVQPRIIGGGFRFAAIGPTPGFTDPQLNRLALLYVVASVRRGVWMIPAYHCVLDDGIPNGHDDPQNFNLDAWSKQIEQLQAALN